MANNPYFNNDVISDSGDSTDTVLTQNRYKTPPPLDTSFGNSLSPPRVIAVDNNINLNMSSNGNNHSIARIPKKNYTKTSKEFLPLPDIISNAPTSFNERKEIFSNIACDNSTFNISYYVKTHKNNQDQNKFMIVIKQNKIKRGTKRKANTQQIGPRPKRRRLNDRCDTQSISINDNNGTSSHSNDDDDYVVSDHIEMEFIIHFAATNGKCKEYEKKHQCIFGEVDCADLNLSDYDYADSESEQYPNINSFATETFEDLTQRIQQSEKLQKDQIGFFVWFELEIKNANPPQNNGYNHNNNKRYNAMQIFKRPIFRHRKITKFVGLRNEGATCYMNSMLQTLYHIASLRRNVYKIPVGHEAEQKKKAEEEEKAKKNNADNMSICDEDNNCHNTDDDDEDDVDLRHNALRQKKAKKPPISLELQRLFYQLQTGAESNHQSEYEINPKDIEQNSKNMDEESDNCSVFSLQSDTEWMDDSNDKKQQKDEDSDDINMRDSSDRWQSSYDKAVSTQELIKSFGWSGGDAFVQHDVQEFLRVLMDKIEAKVKNTNAEKIVEQLFTGEYESYIKCMNVDYESVRNENFQDIQLTIPKRRRRNNGYSSYGRGRVSNDNNEHGADIYDCIKKFIEPERLDGDNQYYANEEHGKQDAYKGLRFKKFPPVLFLHLCRFEMDNYQHTSKINDPVRFYEDIDLNPFIYVEPKEKKCEKKKVQKDMNEINGDNKENMQQNGTNDKNEVEDDNESNGNIDYRNPFYNHLECTENGCGEFSYQLFSVLVHSGSTYGGHYFAYINPSGSRWYKFDDENVCAVSAAEATIKQFGGGNSRASAYMLVYIQKKYAMQILKEINEGDIPKELRKYFAFEKEKARKQRLEQIENEKKCDIWYVNGHDFMNYADDKMINVLDMGMKTLLHKKSVYKDTFVKDLIKEWSEETGIPCEHLMLWNYTERKNKTFRPNREIVLDLNEECKVDPNANYTDDQIQRHLIKTKQEKKKVSSIYDRIGNILEKKRSFILLDRRRILTIGNEEINAPNSKTVLIALKYFDIFEQKSYFIDWIMVKTETVSFGDIAHYIQNKLIPATKSNRLFFEKLSGLTDKMKENEKEKIFCIWEEERASSNKGTREGPVCKISQLEYDNLVDEEFYFGDIFVFQLNPFHSYFESVKPAKIENIKELMQQSDKNDEKKNKLSLTIKAMRYEQEQKGIYWYHEYDKFIYAQATMTNIEIKVREHTGWKKKWTKALIMQYKLKNNIAKTEEIDKEIRKKITKSKHKWQIEANATFGMIRRRLGAYYDINPHHIEIWTPVTQTYSQKFDYGSKGRGQWHQSIKKVISKRSEYRDYCPLRFEIQTYDVADYDKMSLWDEKSSGGGNFRRSSSPNRNITIPQRIKNLAMFNFEFVEPNGGAPGSETSTLTVSHCKDWIAKELIQNILNILIENPIFRYSFFSNIIAYVRKHEMNEKDAKNIDDLTIIKSLKPNRFLVCDMEKIDTPTIYYMDDAYKMPAHFTKIKYTDFRVQFLSHNDPLLCAKPQAKDDDGNENKDKNGAESMEVDNESDTKAIWILFRWENSTRRHDGLGSTRAIFHKSDSIKDIILRDIMPNLKSCAKAKSTSISASSLSSLSINGNGKNEKNGHKEKDKEDDEKSDEDIAYEQILETHSFVIRTKSQTEKLQPRILEKKGILEKVSDVCLIVFVPKQKKQSNSYNRALTING